MKVDKILSCAIWFVNSLFSEYEIVDFNTLIQIGQQLGI